jgi:thiamine-phosphate pyrophosphorylase
MHYNLITKYYFISNFDTNNIDQQNKQTIIIYRNYSSKKIDKTKILKLRAIVKKKD